MRTLATALRHHQEGRLPEAEQMYRRILQADPGNAAVWGLLGDVCQALGKCAEAAASYHQAVRLDPRDAEVHNNLGVVLMAQGKLSEAAGSYRQALLLRPDYAEAHNNLGIALMEQGRLAEAAADFQEALRLRPSYAEAHNNLGIVLARQGQPDEAAAHVRQALQLQPDYLQAHINLASLLRTLGRHDEAAASYQQALRLKPQHAEVHNDLGVTLMEQGKVEEAADNYRQALRQRRDYAEAHNNLGIALMEQGRLAEAAAGFQEALRLRPLYAEAHNNLGNVLVKQGKPEEGVARFHEALRLNPQYAEAHLNRALAWLLMGNFDRGWSEHEWRWQCRDRRPRLFRQPLWDGSCLSGQTILLHAEQGLGDTIQFIRYAPLVKQRGARVIVGPSAMHPLLAGCAGIDQLAAPGSALPEFAVHAPLLSLPWILRTSLAAVPAQVPYLVPRPELVQHWQRVLAPIRALKIGIAWQGNPRYAGDRQRSPRLAQFAPLARVDGIRLFSLQKGPGSEQLQKESDRLAVIDPGPELDTVSGAFMDTAALMKNLDLVITSDTAIPHLAGALGVPVWLVLPLAADWRWLLDRDDSPWYPTIRLFRQGRWGEWDPVFERMAAELKQILAGTSRLPAQVRPR